MSRRSEHSKEELRHLIIDATQKLVAQHGANHVHARQIATEIGYTPGMLYSVFVNLNDIFMHVNTRTLATLFNVFQSTVSMHKNPEVALLELCRSYLRFAQQRNNEFQLLFNKQFNQKDLPFPEDTRFYISSIFNMVEKQLRLITPHKSQCEIRIGMRALWATTHGLAVLFIGNRLFLDKSNHDDTVLSHLVENFLDGWKKTSDAAEKNQSNNVKDDVVRRIEPVT